MLLRIDGLDIHHVRVLSEKDGHLTHLRVTPTQGGTWPYVRGPEPACVTFAYWQAWQYLDRPGSGYHPPPPIYPMELGHYPGVPHQQMPCIYRIVRVTEPGVDTLILVNTTLYSLDIHEAVLIGTRLGSGPAPQTGGRSNDL